MKALIIPLLVLLASCGSTHKIVTSKKTTLDSSSIVTRDTSHVSRETSSSDNLNVQNVHIRVEYAADTALAKAKEQSADGSRSIALGGDFLPYNPPGSANTPFGNSAKIAQAIKDAIAAGGGNGRLPSSIEVDIGSISDSSTQKVKSDSAGSHSSDDKHLKKTENDNSNNTTHTGISIGLKIGIGIFLLILLVIAAWRVYRKFKPI